MINSNKSKLNKKRNPSQANAETATPKAKTINPSSAVQGRKEDFLEDG
jgi:hypothetical protein